MKASDAAQMCLSSRERETVRTEVQRGRRNIFQHFVYVSSPFHKEVVLGVAQVIIHALQIVNAQGETKCHGFSGLTCSITSLNYPMCMLACLN